MINPQQESSLRHRRPSSTHPHQPSSSNEGAVASGSKNVVKSPSSAGSGDISRVSSKKNLKNSDEVPGHAGVKVGEYREAMSALQQKLNTIASNQPVPMLGVSDVREVLTGNKPVVQAFVDKIVDNATPLMRATSSTVQKTLNVVPKGVANALTDNYFLSVTRPSVDVKLPSYLGSPSHQIAPVQLVLVYEPSKPEQFLMQFINRHAISVDAGVEGGNDNKLGLYGGLAHEAGLKFAVCFDKPVHELSANQTSLPDLEAGLNEPVSPNSSGIQLREFPNVQSSLPNTETGGNEGANRTSNTSAERVEYEQASNRKFSIRNKTAFSRMQTIGGLSVAKDSSIESSGVAIMNFRSREYDLDSAGSGRIAKIAARLGTEYISKAVTGAATFSRSGDSGLAHFTAIALNQVLSNLLDHIVKPSAYVKENEGDLYPRNIVKQISPNVGSVLGESIGFKVGQFQGIGVDLGTTVTDEGTKLAPTRKTELKESIEVVERKLAITTADKDVVIEEGRTTASNLQKAEEELKKIQDTADEMKGVVDQFKAGRDLIGVTIDEQSGALEAKKVQLQNQNTRLNFEQKNKNDDPKNNNANEIDQLQQSVVQLKKEVKEIENHIAKLKDVHQNESNAINDSEPQLAEANEFLRIAKNNFKHCETEMKQMIETVNRFVSEEAVLIREAKQLKEESDKIKEKTIRTDYNAQKQAKKSAERSEEMLTEAGDKQQTKVNSFKKTKQE